MKIADHAAMLELAGPNGTIYPALAWDDNSLILIDTGFPGQTDALVAAIAAEGFRTENLTHIILTHHDIDHIGCLPDLLRLVPNAQVIAHEDEAPYIDGRKTPIKLSALLAAYDRLPEEMKRFCDQLQAGFASRRREINRQVNDGDILPMIGGLEVVHTPGHTPGHIALFLPQSKIMIAGDAANIMDDQLIGPNPQHSNDLAQGMLSLEKLKAYDSRFVVSYHCGVWQKNNDNTTWRLGFR